MRRMMDIGLLGLLLGVLGCSPVVTEDSWDNMDFAAVHCDANNNAPECSAKKNSLSMIGIRGGKGR